MPSDKYIRITLADALNEGITNEVEKYPEPAPFGSKLEHYKQAGLIELWPGTWAVDPKPRERP